ncbi:MAG: hypothetical protein OXU36_02765 [Candidatus Poribacteria bacterium]|nr:hypothetical protein [Candidatus Poribacteria bacterium]
MLKKYIGGLTLLVFTFTFTIPLFVAVDTADADPTQIITTIWRTNFFCPDGTYVTYSKGVDVDESYDGHPADEGEWVIKGTKWQCGGGICWEVDNVVWERKHVEHPTATPEVTEVNSVTLWNNRVKCPDDDDEEETTN